MKTRRWLIANGAVALVMLLGSLTGPLPVLERATGPAAPGTLNGTGTAFLTPDGAAIAATNDWETITDGWQLRHPRHTATFTPDGVQFAPRSGRIEWAWRLTSVTADDRPLAGVVTDAVRPVRESSQAVTYSRGGLVEQYLARKNAIEQQFLIPQPLALYGVDLVIAGVVACAGTFEETAQGWLWRDGASAVRLGRVRVYDAAGRDLPATMAVTAAETRIVVDGTALAQAVYPVTIDPEIGANDFRISFMGKDTWYDAYNPAVAYNSHDNEYLVVWHADDNSGTLADDEYEIYGQRVDAATGALLGSSFRISDMGGTGDAGYDAYNPAVAYDSTDNQYLVVWEGDDNTAPLVDEEFEIFGQRLTATGGGVGDNDFRISDMGPDGDANYDAIRPAVAYNSHDNEYLVVWQGDDDTGSLVDNENEIFAQRLNAATGAEVGTNDFRLSSMGGVGDANYDAYAPAVAYNSTGNQYLVVWAGDNTTPGDNETEIFGQLIAATGGGVGANDFRISDMGPDGSTSYAAYSPDVAYNSTDNQYLVVWYGDDDSGSLVNEEYEIYGQRLTAAGSDAGTDFRISDMGPDGSIAYRADYPAVTYNHTSNQYLVVWQGVDDTAPLVTGEQEIFGQRLTSTGGGVGDNDFRISDMGPDGSTSYAAYFPDVAYNSTDNQYLVVWYGDDVTNEEFEVYGQRLTAAGSGTGTNDFRISDMGPDGDIAYRAEYPAVTYNGQSNQYLVVWQGVDNTAPLVAGEQEVFGQLLTATGGGVGPNDFRISDMGPNGSTTYWAYRPAVAYNSTDNEYLVVWHGEDDTPPLVYDEHETFGQRLNSTGAEAGDNDVRLSFMGEDELGNAYDPAVAYNSTNNEYLVVWEGDDGFVPLVNNEYEIWGQRVNAATGALFGPAIRISDMGPDGNANYGAYSPAVAYNSTSNEYLVVWQGDDTTDAESEIYGQRINAATGAEVGTNDFRISDMGPDGDVAYGAFGPAVAYNSADNQYLVVWYGDDNTAPLVDNEYEIFGQRLNATGGGLGANDFRISDMGPDGDTAYDAQDPAVAYDSYANQYLVVWYGDDNTAPLVDNESEIFGQRLAADGAEMGANDFRISDMGPDGDTAYDAQDPAVAYNSHDHQFLVVWEGDDDTGSLVDNEYEIYGQRLTAGGVGTGTNDFRISDMGGTGNADYDAANPAVAYDSQTNEYLVVWQGDDNTAPLVDGEFEIFGQRLNATGGGVGANDFRLSDMGPDGSTAYSAAYPAVAFSSASCAYLVVWYGDDNTLPQVDGEYEIFGQRFAGSFKIYLPIVLK